jgi:DNA-binding MarR family transcriptional regulator
LGQEKVPSLRESLNTSLEVISEEPVLRALLNAIPYVGGSLNEIISGKGQQIIEKRRDDLLHLLIEHMNKLHEEAVRKDFFETPEGFDLLIKALDEARKTRSREKRDLYARILVGAALKQYDTTEYSAEEYLQLVSGLTPKELEVAYRIYRDRPGLKPTIWERYMDTLAEELGISRDDLPMILSRVESLGLIQRVTTRLQGSRVYLPTRPYYNVTPSFEKLMRFVELEAKSE